MAMLTIVKFSVLKVSILYLIVTGVGKTFGNSKSFNVLYLQFLPRSRDPFCIMFQLRELPFSLLASCS